MKVILSFPLFLNYRNMNVYNYIAINNPDAAYEICKNYGFFQISNQQELAMCLQEIVAQQGEEALSEIMEIHPDREILIELSNKKKEEVNNVKEDKLVEKKDCSCNSDSSVKNATGDSTSQVQALPQSQSVIANQTNTYILVAALIVSVAIISMKK